MQDYMNNSGGAGGGGMMSGTGMIPRSGHGDDRRMMLQATLEEAIKRRKQMQAQRGQNVSTFGQLGGTLLGAGLGFMGGGPAGALAGASLGSAVGGAAGKGGQMVVDPQSRTPQNAMGMAQAGMGAGVQYGNYVDKYGRLIPASR